MKNRKRKYVPNKDRAPVQGKYAVIINGKRYLVWHNAGQPLRGKTL